MFRSNWKFWHKENKEEECKRFNKLKLLANNKSFSQLPW